MLGYYNGVVININWPRLRFGVCLKYIRRLRGQTVQKTQNCYSRWSIVSLSFFPAFNAQNTFCCQINTLNNINQFNKRTNNDFENKETSVKGGGGVDTIFVALKTVSHRNHTRPISTTSSTASIPTSRSMYTCVFLFQNSSQKTLQEELRNQSWKWIFFFFVICRIKLNCLPIILKSNSFIKQGFILKQHLINNLIAFYLFLSLSSRETHCEVYYLILHPRVLFQKWIK